MSKAVTLHCPIPKAKPKSSNNITLSKSTPPFASAYKNHISYILPSTIPQAKFLQTSGIPQKSLSYCQKVINNTVFRKKKLSNLFVLLHRSCQR